MRDSCAVEGDLEVSFSNFDWASLRAIYGWSALQYQGWARGTLIIRGNKTQNVVLHTDGVLEFWIDDEPFFGGDFYAFRRSPLIIALTPGLHKIDLRLLRDIRAMGGVGNPNVRITLRAEVASNDLSLAVNRLLLPEFIDGCCLSSDWGSLPVSNTGDDWISIVRIQCEIVSQYRLSTRQLSPTL